MRLDQTHVRIRERNVLEILDLAFQVIRAYWRPLLFLTILGALPWVLLNHWLTAWMLDFDRGGSDASVGYMWCRSLLVMIEAPLGSLLIVAYLGHAVFDESPGLKRIFGDVWKGTSKLFWTLFCLRSVGPMLLLMLWSKFDEGEWNALRVFLIFVIFVWALGLRLFRPFVVELIVLEQPTWRSTDPLHPSFGQRSGQIHNAAAGVLFGRGLLYSLVMLVMIWVVYGGLATVFGFWGNNWFPSGLMMTVIWPICMWLTNAYLTVARFLSYLDIRIRQEGWEVELLIRAEAQKIEESLV